MEVPGINNKIGINNYKITSSHEVWDEIFNIFVYLNDDHLGHEGYY